MSLTVRTTPVKNPRHNCVVLKIEALYLDLLEVILYSILKTFIHLLTIILSMFRVVLCSIISNPSLQTYKYFT